VKNALKEKLMNVQEDLGMADAWIRAAHRRNFRYSDIWRKKLEDMIQIATNELEDAIREYQRIFENNK
jgi:uncharacterized protein YllA (UPF0747 family)